MFADVYYAAGQRGIDPETVDRLEVWQVAAMLGADYDRDQKDPEPETPAELAAAYHERERLRSLGRLDDFYKPHDGGMN